MKYVMDFTPCPKIVFGDVRGSEANAILEAAAEVCTGRRYIPTMFFVLPGVETSSEFIPMRSLSDAFNHVGSYTNVSLRAPDGTTPSNLKEQLEAKPFNKDQMLEYSRSVLLAYFHELDTTYNTYVMFVSVEDDVFNYDHLAACAELSRRLGRMIDKCLPEHYLEWRSAHDDIWGTYMSSSLYQQLTLQGVIDYLSKYDDRYVVEFGLGMPHSYRGFYEQLAFPVQANVSIAEMRSRAQDAIGQTFIGYKGGNYTMQPDTLCWAVQQKGETGEPLTIRHLRTFRITNFDEIGQTEG